MINKLMYKLNDNRENYPFFRFNRGLKVLTKINLNSIKVPKVLSQRMTLGTSVIYTLLPVEIGMNLKS